MTERRTGFPETPKAGPAVRMDAWIDARMDAQAAAYRLFARLFFREVTTDLRMTLAALPELGDTLSEPFDQDEVAAEHHRLLGLQVPPWAGVFLDPEGRIGGASATVVRELYGRAGLEVDERSEEADHLGLILTLLSELRSSPALAAETLDRALLPWLPWLVEAIDRHGGEFHRTLAGLTLELALDHRLGLGRLPVQTAAPQIDDPLGDADGLSEIATFLVTPARSGLYLARDDVRRLAALEELPAGFGGRADSLETLLRGAAEYAALSRVVDGLLALVEEGRVACAALTRSGGAATAAPVATRLARLTVTETVLARLKEAAVQMT